MKSGQRIIAAASVAEAATGLGLVAVPYVVVGLLLGAELEGVAIVLSRVAGIALISLAIACWPDGDTERAGRSYFGMLLYNALVAVLLLIVGIGGEASGALLWPVVLLHGVLSVLLAWAWSRQR
jgi:hypothetical protein